MKALTLAGAAAAAALSFCAASAASAADAPEGTVEVGYTHAGWDTSIGDLNFNTVHLRGSLQANKYWGGELELGFGVGSDTILGADVKQQTEAGLYVDGYLPLNKGENGDLIVRAGWSRTVVKVSGGGGSVDGANKGAAVGVGYRYFFKGSDNGFRIDYTHYFYDEDVKVNAFSIGYVRKF